MEILGWIFLILIIFTIFKAIKLNKFSKRIPEMELERKRSLFALAKLNLAEEYNNGSLPSWYFNENKTKNFLDRVIMVSRAHGLPDPISVEVLQRMVPIIAASAAAVERVGGNERDQEDFAAGFIQVLMNNYGVEIFHKGNTESDLADEIYFFTLIQKCVE